MFPRFLSPHRYVEHFHDMLDCALPSAETNCLNVFDDTRLGREVDKRVTAEEVRVKESLYGFSHGFSSSVAVFVWSFYFEWKATRQNTTNIDEMK